MSGEIFTIKLQEVCTNFIYVPIYQGCKQKGKVRSLTSKGSMNYTMKVKVQVHNVVVCTTKLTCNIINLKKCII